MIERLMLFGATGDLTGRYLFPAIATLFAQGHLPDSFSVTCAARQDLDDEAFRRGVDERLAEHAGDVPLLARQMLLRSLRYQAVDVSDPASVASLFAGQAAPVAAYLALPPSLFPDAVGGLDRAGLPAGSRIVLEKPFGEDLDSAISLNRLLAGVAGGAGEQAIFRVDHVLGMATAHNLVALRQNRVLDSVWNGTHVAQVEILWEETLALEGRAGYYDRAGALKDVLQNHMLQVMCLVAMEPPGSADERELSDRKVDVLRSVRPPSSAEIPFPSRRARYGAGRLTDLAGASGRTVPAYADEDGVEPMRDTETFVELTLELETARWQGTPFVLRGGKALRRRRKGVLFRFRSSDGQAANELWIGIDGPSDIVLRLTGGTFGRATDVELCGEPPSSDLPAYGRVLLDVLTGGSLLSVRADEAEQAWRVVTPVLDSWRANQVPLEEYAAGSDGPRR
jgi:glucose-6-phosphate 1-dehydrogenase